MRYREAALAAAVKPDFPYEAIGEKNIKKFDTLPVK